MKGLTHLIMLSCLKATEMAERKISSRLSLLDTIKLHYHYKICSVCRDYENQSAIIEKLIKDISVKPEYEIITDKEKISRLKADIIKKLETL